MADTKVTGLTAIDAVAADDLFYVVDDVAGTPTGKKATASQLKTYAAPAASDTVAGVIEIAVQSEMETATSTTLAVTPGRQQYHPSAAKAWANWANTTTISAGHNISSITDHGTGEQTTSYTTSFSSASYSVIPSVLSSTTSCMARVHTQATGSARFFFHDLVGDPQDFTEQYMVAFGDQ